MRFLWVGFAGAVGSMARYAIGVRVDQHRFPWATLGINVVGAFVLGLFLTFALGRVPAAVMTPISVGLIGGFTTFSTFAWEGFALSRSGRTWTAIVYIAVSVVGGLVAAAIGHAAARSMIR